MTCSEQRAANSHLDVAFTAVQEPRVLLDLQELRTTSGEPTLLTQHMGLLWRLFGGYTIPRAPVGPRGSDMCSRKQPAVL